MPEDTHTHTHHGELGESSGTMEARVASQLVAHQTVDTRARMGAFAGIVHEQAVDNGTSLLSTTSNDLPGISGIASLEES